MSANPSESSGVFVILNRRARHLREDASKMRAAILLAGARAHVVETRSLEELSEAARTIASASSSGVVVLAGGDGSHMAGVSELSRAFQQVGRELPVVALAPGGTVCTVARNWGLRASPAYAASVVRAAIHGAASVVPRSTLRVRDDQSGDRVGFIFGAGLVASFFDVYYASEDQGYGAAARIVARIFAGSFTGGALARRVLDPVACTLEVDGAARAPGAWSLIVASVVRDLGLSMRVTYRAAEESERFHAVASALPARMLGPQMPRVLTGRALRGAGHVDALAKTLRVTFAGTRGAYVLDGEVLRAKSVSVEGGPSLRVLSLR